MPLFLLSTSEALDLYLDKENNWLYLDWKGTLDLANVQADCQKILAYAAQLAIKKALNDNTHIVRISRELVKWVAEKYLPAAGRLGVDYVAWVHSPALDCRRELEQLLLMVDSQPPQVSMFDDVAAAYGWLQHISAPVAPVE
jgi:hypothetical protein